MSYNSNVVESNMTMEDLLNEDVFRIMEYQCESLYSVERISDMLDEKHVVFTRFLEISGYYRPPSKSSSDKLIMCKSVTTQNSNATLSDDEKCFIVLLSSICHLDEIQTTTILKEYIQKSNQNALHGSKDTSTPPSIHSLFNLATISSIRNFYFQQRTFLWKALHELLEAAYDTCHIYYNPCRIALSKLIERGLVENIIKLIQTSFTWTFPYQNIEIQGTATATGLGTGTGTGTGSWLHHLSRVEQLQFLSQCSQNWAKQGIQEAELLSALIQIASDSSYGLPRRLVRVLDKTSFIRRMEYQQESFAFRWMGLFAQMFQFSSLLYSSSTSGDMRISSSSSQLQLHALISTFDDRNADIIHEIILQNKSTNEMMMEGEDSNQTIAAKDFMLLLWTMFLTLCSSYTTKQQQQQQQQQSVSLSTWLDRKCTLAGLLDVVKQGQGQALSWLSLLSDHVMNNNQNGIVSGTEEHLTSAIRSSCLAFQDVINAALSIRVITLEHNDMMILTKLVDAFYRGDKSLCRGLWSRWSSSIDPNTNGNGIAADPLCVLVHQLAVSVPHEPLYLLKILRAICCDRESSDTIITMLITQTVHLISHEHISSFAVSISSSPAVAGGISSQWMSAEEYLQVTGGADMTGCRVKYVQKNQASNTPESGSTGIGSGPGSGLNLAVPVQGSEGKLLQWNTLQNNNINNNNNINSNTALIRWSSQSTWWAIILDVLGAGSTNTNKTLPRDDMMKLDLISAATSLITNLLRHTTEVEVRALQQHWSELCLLCVLREAELEDLFPDLNQRNITVQILVHEQDNISSILKNIFDGISNHEIDKLLTITSTFSPTSSTNSMMNILRQPLFKVMIQMLFDILKQLLNARPVEAASPAGIAHTSALSCIISLLTELTHTSESVGRDIAHLLLEAFPVSGPLSLCNRTIHHVSFTTMKSNTSTTSTSTGSIIPLTDSVFTILSQLCGLILSLIPHFCTSQTPHSCLRDLFCSSINEIPLIASIDAVSSGSGSLSSSSDNVVSKQSFVSVLQSLSASVPLSSELLGSLFEMLDRSHSGWIPIGRLLEIGSMKFHIDYSSGFGSGFVGGNYSNSNSTSTKTAMNMESVRRIVWNIIENAIITNGSGANSISDFSFVLVDSFIFELIIPALSYFEDIQVNHFYGNSSNTLSSLSPSGLFINKVLCTLSAVFDYTQITGSSLACQELVRRLVSDPRIVLMIIRIACALGYHSVTAVRRTSSSVVNKDNSNNFSFKQFSKINTTPNNKSGTPSFDTTILYPIDFTRGSVDMRAHELDTVLDTSYMAVKLCLDMINFVQYDAAASASSILSSSSSEAQQESNKLKSLQYMLAILAEKRYIYEDESHGQLFTNKHINTSGIVPCSISYLAVLVGWIFYPNILQDSSHHPLLRLSLPHMAINILSKVAECTSLTTFLAEQYDSTMKTTTTTIHPLIDYLGWNNITPLCVSLSSHIESQSSTNEMRIAIVDLLLNLAVHQPVSLSALIRCSTSQPKRRAETLLTLPKSFATASSTASQQDNTTTAGAGAGAAASSTQCLERTSSLITGLESIFSDECFATSSIYNICPLLLHKALELVIRLWSHLECPTLIQAGLQIARNRMFWVRAMEPLMENLSPSSSTSSSSTSPSATRSDILASEKDTVSYCHKILAHASALNAISQVEIRAIRALDVETGKIALHSVETFLERANQSHRFVAWVNHYMRVDIDEKLIKDTEHIARELGVSLEALIPKPCTLSMNQSQGVSCSSLLRTESIGGGSYIYSVDSLRELGNRSGQYSDTSGQWRTLEEYTTRLNRMWSVVDSQATLLGSWRVFMEVFVSASVHATHSGIPRTLSSATDHDGSPFDSSSSLCAPQSPASLRESSFAGDKRSYCLVKEVAKQLAEECRSGAVGAVVTLEKCDLLVAMLHHQLREVSFRASDPRHARVELRDMGSTRLTSPKMIELLYMIVSAHRRMETDLVFTSDPPEGILLNKYANKKVSWRDLKQVINAKVFTALLLLLDALDLDGKRSGSRLDANEDFIRLTQRIFHIALTCMKDEIRSNRMTIFTNNNSSNATNSTSNKSGDSNGDGNDTSVSRLPTSQALLKICLQVMTSVIPIEFDRMNTSIATLWVEDVRKSQLISTVLGLFRNLSSSEMAIAEMQKEHNYCHWADVTAVHPDGNVRARFKSYHDPKSVINISTAAILVGVSDLLLRCLQSESSVCTDLLAAGVVREMATCPLLHAFQETVCTQPTAKVAAFMSYSSSHGEVGAVSVLWQSVLHLVHKSIRVSSASQCAELHTNTTKEVCEFLHAYNPLVLLPLFDSNSRKSIQQLHLCKDVLSLIAGVDTCMSGWRTVVPTLWTELSRRLKAFIGKFTLLLGVDVSHQRELHGVLVAVSMAEQREESCLRSRRRLKKLLTSKGVSAKIAGLHSRSPSHGTTPPSPRSSSLLSLEHGPSPSSASFRRRSDSPTGSGSGSPSSADHHTGSGVGSSTHKTSWNKSHPSHSHSAASTSVSDNLRDILVQLIADAQTVIVEVLVEAFAILWTAMPSPEEYNYDSQEGFYPSQSQSSQSMSMSLSVGSRMFFRVPMWTGLMEGTVTAVHREGHTLAHPVVGYTAVTPDGSRVDFIPTPDVACTTLPLFPFTSVEILTMGLASPPPPIASTSASSLDGSNTQQLASWSALVFVKNCDHIRKCFPDINLFREQIIEVQSLLCKKTRSQSVLETTTASSTTSTSSHPYITSCNSTSGSSSSIISDSFLDNPEWLSLVEILLASINTLLLSLDTVTPSKQKEIVHVADKDLQLTR
eukprot:gene7198-14675_t